MNTTRTGQIPPLTGLRFAAAAVVVAHHFAPVKHGLLRNFFAHGFVGVTLFFVLSGFILSYTYIDSSGAMKGTKRDFWAARIARLYPTYIVGFVLCTPFVILWRHLPMALKIASAAESLALIQAWFHLASPWFIWGMWNPPGWSLSAEAFFYLTFPFISVALSRASGRVLFTVLIACWIASASATLSYLGTGGAAKDFWMYDPALRLPEFVIGVVVGLAWKRGTISRLDSFAPYASVLALTALTAFLSMDLHDAYYFNGMTAPFAAVLICSLASDRGVLASFFSWRPIVFLGQASFSLYILHWPLRDLFGYAGDKLSIPQDSTALFAVYFVGSVATACLCFRYIEEPMNKLLRARLTAKSGFDRSRADALIAPLDAKSESGAAA